jgi:hypothetical protein
MGQHSKQASQTQRKADGPLRIHPTNPRYFADPAGRAVYLAGSHTWANWIEHKVSGDEPDFDFDGFLDFMVAHNHNFMRLWGWEHAHWATWDGTGRFFAYPLAYARTGPGTALDGLPKFDLSRFDPAYFERLRRRVIAAGERGIYVAVKFFDGFSVGFKGDESTDRWVPARNPYRGHPFHAANNVNDIDGDPDHTGQGKAIQSLRIPAITRLQEAYVRAVIETVNDLDNVLYEICNESDGTSEAVEWQYHLIRFVKQYQAGKPKQHPVGMTVPYPGGRNEVVVDSPADWVSPNHTDQQPYMSDPPSADGSKVIVSDTDHIWGHGGEQAWVFKSFTRGLNVLLMDPWEPLKGSDLHTNNYRDHPTWPPVRRSMGCVRALADRMDLASMVPANESATTGYCLASPGREYVIYQPDSGAFEVDLTTGQKPYSVEWLDPTAGTTHTGGLVDGGARRSFTPPFAGDAVLYLKAEAT